jgi:CubicO group peptidase (beta-lactamase class C family)
MMQHKTNTNKSLGDTMKNAAIVLILICVTGCGRSDAETVLVPGQPVSAALESNSQADYATDLEANSFVYGEINQIDFDVKVTVLDPNGNIVDSFDRSARGAEPIRFETKTAGRFTIRVEGFEEESGNYSIALQRAEPVATNPQERLDQLLSAFAGDDTPGAIVAVIREGEIIHHQAVGMANLTYGIPFDRQTVSNIGSVSKQFTAFAVAKLAADGLLSLDDDVRKYFPEIPDLGHVVTVRNILNHTNGYREFLNLLFMAGVRLDNGDFISRDEVLRILERQPALQDEPGSRYNYNNTAYALAALLVEQVTDTPFQVWMKENVFTPLEMTHTRIRSQIGEIVPNAAEGYVAADEAPYRIGIDLGGGGGAVMGPGGIYTTIDDLAKWIGNFKSGEVGGAAVVAELMTPQIEMPGEDRFYGLGLIIDKQRGLSRAWHNGADTAHRAELLYFPEIDAGIVAMSNNGSFNSSMARDVAAAFFEADMEAEELPESTSDATETTDTAPTSDIDTAVFERFVGQYEFNDYPGVVIIVSLDEGNVFVQSPGGSKQPASPLSATSLSLGADQSLEFNLDDNGVVESLTTRGGNELTATKLEDWAPASTDLAVYTGRYFSEELDTVYSVEMEDEGLVLRHRRLEDVEMTPKVTDTFNGSGAISEIKFVRNENGELTGLMASNVRTLNVWFKKQD